MQKLVVALTVLAALVFGCATKSQTGALAGAGLGAATGAAISGGDAGGMLLGGVIGAALGFGAGKLLEERDRKEAADALETTPSQRTVAWKNPDTGVEYQMTPKDTYYSESGEPCRHFLMNVKDESGTPQEVKGTACRSADGNWRIV